MKTKLSSNGAARRQGWRLWGVAVVVAANWVACRSPMRGRSDGGEDAVANRIPDATGTADLIDVIVAPDAGHVCCPEPRSRVLPSKLRQ